MEKVRFMGVNIQYSFIIPHYDIPSLLDRCVNSIPGREDIEVIVVDDGSRYRPQSLRDDVKLITLPEHRGAGFARNAGLKEAVGRWILFPDSDDFYNPGFIDTLDRYADSDLEILFFSVDSRDSDTLAINERRSREIQRIVEAAADGDRDALDHLFYRSSSACHKMFSKRFLDEWQIQFEEISRCNDVLFSLNTNYHAKRYAVIKERLYCISYRKCSLSYSRRTRANYIDTIAMITRRNEFYDAVGRKRYKSSFVNMFIGFDNPLKRANPAEELCNCLIYAVKVLFVLTSHFRMLYKERMNYVRTIVE